MEKNPKEKKKRGRKPKIKETIDESKLVSENKNNIIHLKIKKEECDNLNSTIDNYDKNDIYYEFDNLINNDNKNQNYKIQSYPYDNVISNDNNKNINCYWCCHSFNSTVFTLPTRLVNNVYYVYGCFCSPECACAYNFNDHKDSYQKWERYSLLNLLYKQIFNNNKLEIVSALPRETLKSFGGIYNIEEYRNINNNYKKRIELLNYPLVSHNIIHNEIEINNFLENKDKKSYIPLNESILEETKDNLKLKRSKPLNKNINTLEKCMNLKYN